MIARTCLVITVVLSAACASRPAVDVYLTKITPLPSTFFEQRARVDIRIQNLTRKPIAATGMDLRLEVNDRPLARGVDSKPFTLAGLEDTTTSVVVSSSVFDTVRQLLGLPGRETFSYGLTGKIHTGGFGKPFSRKGELSRADLQSLVPPGTK